MYFVVLLDLYSRRAVGWSMSNEMPVQLVTEPFRQIPPMQKKRTCDLPVRSSPTLPAGNLRLKMNAYGSVTY